MSLFLLLFWGEEEDEECSQDIDIGYLRNWKNTQNKAFNIKIETRNAWLQLHDMIVYFLEENIPNTEFFSRLIFLNFFFHSTFPYFLTQIVPCEIKKEHTRVTHFMKMWFLYFPYNWSNVALTVPLSVESGRKVNLSLRVLLYIRWEDTLPE